MCIVSLEAQTMSRPFGLWVLKECGSEVWSPVLSTNGFCLISPKPPLFCWSKEHGLYNGTHHVWHPFLSQSSWEGRQQNVFLFSLFHLSSLSSDPLEMMGDCGIPPGLRSPGRYPHGRQASRRIRMVATVTILIIAVIVAAAMEAPS